jgi:hypothetical protein
MELHTTATLHADGSISGTTATSASGPFATELRRDAAWIEATGDGAAASQLDSLGDAGFGSFAFDPPGRLAPGYAVSGSFVLDARPELLAGESFTPPAGLRLLARPGDVLLGPAGQLHLSEDEPSPCYPGRQVEEVTLTLPQGRLLRRLPADLEIDEDAISYRSTWAVSGATLTRHAELTVRAADAPCGGVQRHRMAAALARIRRDLRTQVALAQPEAEDQHLRRWAGARTGHEAASLDRQD